MGTFVFLISYIVFLSLFVFSVDSASSSCPIDLGYVETYPWDTSSCRSGDQDHCCMALLSLFGMGLAQHLKETSMFQLPTAAVSSSCLSELQTRLSAMAFQPSLVSICFKNSTQFVANSSSCAGIITKEDWIKRVGEKTALDSSCKDLTGLVQCGSCLDAGMKVNSQLQALAPNSTKCFYFTILYAAGIVNELGPQDGTTAACILGLPLSNSKTGETSNHLSQETLFKLIFGFLGAFMVVLFALGSVVLYRIWQKKKKNAFHEEFVSSMQARVLPNTGAKWYHIAEIERATDGFSQKNFIGQGAYGAVHKGTLSDGTLVAVKQILDLDSQGDEEFSNEVEIISKIRHRNLLSLRGCCVTSDDCKGKGVAYLHDGIKPAIYHRDIKTTNILLDLEMKAKVADFGLAKQSREGQSHLTTRVAGTHGYLAPEYALYGQLTEKSDVYSFGIVILETMSGRKVLDTSSSSMVLITDWAWMLVKSGKVEEVFDDFIRKEGPKGVMERFVLVGILCAHVMVAFRPTIAEALKMLEGDIDIPRLPDRPWPLSHEAFRSSLQCSFLTNERSRPSTSMSTI
ncbi:probable receptor-like protein kinase At1g11050 [Vitis riparia]|uniref:probable receptor-like protein kinase At1g11050 n=1 Tax=Vitis riparia TaxID=96939 RepID=UPI00155A34C2|nr:probable receptor-like protein kinase At1g11050 [Vitis riparia]